MGQALSVLGLSWVEILTHKVFGFPEDLNVLVKSLSFKENDVKMVLRSLSFKKENLGSLPTPKEPKKMVLEHSLSFKRWEEEQAELQNTTSLKSPSSDNDHSKSMCFGFANREAVPRLPTSNSFVEFTSPRPKCELDAAAVKLQKVYKSYRTRRNLADCAVVVEELWWKALDFASLRRSSISFFDVEKPETAISRWARARTRVAKVGKGLSKDDKAQKLALRHWLEAIDPRHRYGHNLHLYYDIWFDSESTQPFFYWLDVGDGKDVNLEKCPRSKLQQQLIKYLGPAEREAHEVIVECGKLVYKQSQMLVNTVEGSKWIFVLSTSRNLYVGQKKKGSFQHSSFLAGAATTSAGRLVAIDGVLKAIWPYSGHYLPTEENFTQFVSFLADNNVDLTDVKKCSVDDDEFPSSERGDKNEMEAIAAAKDVDSALVVDLGGSKMEEPPEESANADNHAENSVDTMEPPAFELSKRLSCKWSTGAGPRIGIVRDYPMDLQIRALEHVNLSPRVTASPAGVRVPIPSPRPSPRVRLSPRLSCMGFPSPTVALQLPTPKNTGSTVALHLPTPKRSNPTVALHLPTPKRSNPTVALEPSNSKMR